MAQPVWVLSVDLQTKTATFQTGLAEAARSARSSFKDISSGAADMGEGVSRGSLDVRHALGLVDNTIRGAHTMAMADLIRMFKDSALVMGALPFAMTAAGIALVAELAVKGAQAWEEYRQAAEKLRDENTKFHTSIQDVFNGLDEKILEAAKQTDDLTGNHLGALQKELQIIDRQSLSELAHSFDIVAKSADQLFGDLKAGWYQMGIGSEGARHALDEFQTQYESLLAQGKGKEASGLLAGTLAQAREILAAQQQMQHGVKPTGNNAVDNAAYTKGVAAHNELIKAGVGWTDKEVQSQQALIDTLNAQVTVEQKIATLQSEQQHNARLQTAKAMAPHQASQNQIDSKVAAGRAAMMRDLYAQYEQQVQIVQDGERETIAATKEGSAERLQAIEDAMQKERSIGLQDTAYYKQLATQELEVQREITEAQKRAALESAQVQAHAREQMAAEEGRHQAQMMQLKQGQSSGDPKDILRIAQERQQADAEYAIKRAAMEQQLALYKQGGADQVKQAQQTQLQLNLLDKQYADRDQELKKQQEQATKASLAKIGTDYAQTFLQIAEGHETLAKTMEKLANQAASTMITASMQLITQHKSEQLAAAKAAAAGAWNAMSHIPVVGPELGAIAAAATFAGCLAFQTGTDRVPGVGKGDTVPSMLEPGEGIVPGGVMDGLSKMARQGQMSGGGTTHVTHYSPVFHINAIDSDGVKEMLDKHTEEFSRHYERQARRMNH